jgi:hypothetical protein
MKEQSVSYWLKEIVGYLNRTGADNLVIPKEPQYSRRIADDVEEYLLDIKQMFIDKCKQEPSCRKENVEHAWQSMKGIIRKDVEKLFEKQVSARNMVLDGSERVDGKKYS